MTVHLHLGGETGQVLLEGQGVYQHGGSHLGRLFPGVLVGLFLLQLRPGIRGTDGIGRPLLAQFGSNGLADASMPGAALYLDGSVGHAVLEDFGGPVNGFLRFGSGPDEVHQVADVALDVTGLRKAGLFPFIALIDGVLNLVTVFQHPLGVVAGGALVQLVRGADGDDGADPPGGASNGRVEFAPDAFHAIVGDG